MDYYNISASSFAETIDVPRSSISHILSGRNKPSLDFVLKTTETYSEVDLYWLLKGIGTFPKSNTPLHTKPIASEKNEKENLKLDFNPQIKTNETQPTDRIEKSVNHGNIEKKEIERIVIFYKDGSYNEYSNLSN
ncbi:helix-turn-helix domain-containing protein [Flavicella marina]|uniref:helix-turn-helix domain-containing protein n=1 Tax=Flavicella marina TaxID=1475951 RepID=UPI001D00A139|nr:helix-turn-helix transcriptional regulator [Flavicella marina]